jgi:hypothetical protein
MTKPQPRGAPKPRANREKRAEREGFEPSMDETAHTGFRDRLSCSKFPMKQGDFRRGNGKGNDGALIRVHAGSMRRPLIGRP